MKGKKNTSILVSHMKRQSHHISVFCLSDFLVRFFSIRVLEDKAQPFIPEKKNKSQACNVVLSVFGWNHYIFIFGLTASHTEQQSCNMYVNIQDYSNSSRTIYDFIPSQYKSLCSVDLY